MNLDSDELQHLDELDIDWRDAWMMKEKVLPEIEKCRKCGGNQFYVQKDMYRQKYVYVCKNCCDITLIA